MVLHDTCIGYMRSLSCMEILKYVLFLGLQRPTIIENKITGELLESVASLEMQKLADNGESCI